MTIVSLLRSNPNVTNFLASMQAVAKSDQFIQFEKAFLAPRYWSTWLMMGFVWLSSSLPRPVAIKIGDGVGWLFKSLNKKRRHIVKTNLALCFPNRSAKERLELLNEHYRYYGRSVVDLGLLWWAPFKRLEKLITFKGEQAYLETLKKHNVILILPHFIGLDCAGSFSSILHPSISMMKTQKNALLNWQLWRGRTRFKPTRVIMRDQGLRPLIKAARNGVACYYMPDEDFGESSLTLYAPFFGQSTSTLTTLPRMAKMANAKVVAVLPRMNAAGSYEVEFTPALQGFPSGDDMADAVAVNQVIEEAVNVAPAQYMWTLQWFRSQPNNQPSPYL